MSVYEKHFAKSHKTDAILIVDGKKLHVNKAFLSYHSDYFDTLFNSEFKEKTMEEIEIKDVNFEEFAAVLSLVHLDPVLPTRKNAETLLELADQFLLPAAKRYVELFLTTTKMDKYQKLRIADKYDLNLLRNHAISHYNERDDFKNIYNCTKTFSDHTKSKLYGRYFNLCQNGYMVF